jgi:hypothetical protein
MRILVGKSCCRRGKDQPAVKISNDGGKTFGGTVVLSNAFTPIVDAKVSTE